MMNEMRGTFAILTKSRKKLRLQRQRKMLTATLATTTKILVKLLQTPNHDGCVTCQYKTKQKQ